MRRIVLLGAIFLGLAAPAGAQVGAGGALIGTVVAHSTAHHHYWWIPLSDCTISTATTRQGTLRGTPYVQCAPSGGIGWRSTPEQLNQSDNVFAPPDMSMGTAPCDYEDVPCAPAS